MQNERGQPPDPYDAHERDVSEEHPIDVVVERRVPQRKLRRRMRQASDRLLQALGDRRELWLRLEELLGLYRARREEAYFNLGYEHGVTADRVEGLRVIDGSMPPDVHPLAVLPLRMEAETVTALDEARVRLGLKSRMDLIRRALHSFLDQAGEREVAGLFGDSTSAPSE